MQGQVRLGPKPGAGARLQEPLRGLPGAAPRGARPSAPQSPRPTGGLPFSPGVTLRLQRAVCSVCATAELQRRQLGGPSRFPTRAPSGGTVRGAWGCSRGPPRVCPCLCPSAVLGWSPCTSDSVTTWPVHVRSAWSSRLRGLRDRGGAGTSACNGPQARRGRRGLQPGAGSPGRSRAQDGFEDKAAEGRGRWWRSAPWSGRAHLEPLATHLFPSGGSGSRTCPASARFGCSSSAGGREGGAQRISGADGSHKAD